MDRERVALLRTLAVLRACAVGGQAAAVYTATELLDLALDPRPLYAGCLALAGFGAWAGWRAWRATRAGTATVLAHVALDLVALTWMLYWSGGPANPFVSLYLLPIALVAFALRPGAVVLVALAAAAGYSLLMVAHVPIPHQHGDAAFFDLHLVGMWVNFLLSATLFTLFASRLSALIGRQRHALARSREDALRNEGILAVATQAAATAHALNTPLSTMAVLLSDLADEHAADPRLGPELATLRKQVDACRDAVRQLAVEAEAAPRGAIGLDALVRRALDRLQVMRPDALPALEGLDSVAGIKVHDDPRIEHLLLNLLNNALDASRAAAREGTSLRIACTAGALRFVVADRGHGFRAAPIDFSSSKPDGLGLGLTLSRVIAEHFDGAIEIRSRDGGGEVAVSLPLHRLAIA
jgi:two-component system sensor histidine kinase RegB